MIQSYFNRVRSKLKEISPLIKTDHVSIEMVSADMGILRGKIIFVDGSVLDVSSSEELNFTDVLEYIKKDMILRLFKDKH